MSETSDTGDETRWIEVRRVPDRRRWLELALVMAALGIEHRVETGAGYRLLVRPEDAERACRELAEYEAEADAPPEAEPGVPQVAGSGFLPGYWVALLTLQAFSSHRVFGHDWVQAGRAHAGFIAAGQWWRTVTALTLHADASHLLNNLVFGSLFGVFLAQEVGVGWAWLGLVASGAAANAINAFLLPPAHASIGASTAVFGAVGLLMGLQSRRPAGERSSRLRRWAPPVIGAVFLGFLGTAGERTDVMAHLTGVVAGMVLGWLAGGPARRWHLASRRQHLPAALALLSLAVAWWLALGK